MRVILLIYCLFKKDNKSMQGLGRLLGVPDLIGDSA